MTVVELVANAIGLVVAKWLLPGFAIDLPSFLVVVAIFTAARFVLAPLVFKLSFRYARVLTGGIALVITFVGLFVTTLLTDGLTISGFSTWVLATLIVWLFGGIYQDRGGAFATVTARSRPNAVKRRRPTGLIIMWEGESASRIDRADQPCI